MKMASTSKDGQQHQQTSSTVTASPPSLKWSLASYYLQSCASVLASAASIPGPHVETLLVQHTAAAVSCLESILSDSSSLSPALEIVTRLKLVEVLLAASWKSPNDRILKIAQAHIERAILLSTQMNDNPDYKFQSKYLLIQILELENHTKRIKNVLKEAIEEAVLLKNAYWFYQFIFKKASLSLFDTPFQISAMKEGLSFAQKSEHKVMEVVLNIRLAQLHLRTNYAAAELATLLSTIESLFATFEPEDIEQMPLLDLHNAFLVTRSFYYLLNGRNADVPQDITVLQTRVETMSASLSDDGALSIPIPDNSTYAYTTSSPNDHTHITVQQLPKLKFITFLYLLSGLASLTHDSFHAMQFLSFGLKEVNEILAKSETLEPLKLRSSLQWYVDLKTVLLFFLIDTHTSRTELVEAKQHLSLVMEHISKYQLSSKYDAHLCLRWGMYYIGAGESEKAYKWFGGVLERTTQPELVLLAKLSLTTSLLCCHRAAEAEVLLQQVETIISSNPSFSSSPLFSATLSSLKSIYSLLDGAVQKTKESALEALRPVETLSSSLLKVMALSIVGAVYWNTEDLVAAEKMLLMAYGCAKKMRFEGAASGVTKFLAGIYARSGDDAKSAKYQSRSETHTSNLEKARA